MNFLSITIGSMVLVCALLWVYFRNGNRKIRLDFSERSARLSEQLQLHEIQIKKRSAGLDRYDFLKYNVEEALVIQTEIKI